MVSAVFLLGSVFGIVAGLYGSGALLTRIELAWLASQQPLVSAGSQPLGDETVVTLTRTTCEGTCPAYKVTLYGSGRVEFRGDAYVCEKSPRATRVDPIAVKRLVDGLLALGFSTMPSYTDQGVTDNPTATISVKHGGTTHGVEHYRGDANAPRLLFLIEARIDEVAGTSAWLGVQKGWQRMCMTADGKFVPTEPDAGWIKMQI